MISAAPCAFSSLLSAANVTRLITFPGGNFLSEPAPPGRAPKRETQSAFGIHVALISLMREEDEGASFAVRSLAPTGLLRMQLGLEGQLVTFLRVYQSRPARKYFHMPSEHEAQSLPDLSEAGRGTSAR